MKKHVSVLLLAILAAACVFAANSYYEKGDTAFSFNVGVEFPAFIAFTGNSDLGFAGGMTGTHAKLGGFASLAYQAFVTKSLALGGEIGYAFNNSRADKLFTTVPITAKLSWYPVQTGKFDLILHTNAGISVLKYDNQRFLAPHVELSLNPVLYITESWGIGLNGGIWANIEFYGSSASGEKPNDTAIGGFCPLTLSLIYRH